MITMPTNTKQQLCIKPTGFLVILPIVTQLTPEVLIQISPLCSGFETTSTSNMWLRMKYCLQTIWKGNGKFHPWYLHQSLI